MRPIARRRPGQVVGEGGSKQKGHTKPGLVDGEERDALSNRCCGRARREDGAKDRPYAGRPAEAKGEPEDIG